MIKRVACIALILSLSNVYGAERKGDDAAPQEVLEFNLPEGTPSSFPRTSKSLFEKLSLMAAVNSLENIIKANHQFIQDVKSLKDFSTQDLVDQATNNLKAFLILSKQTIQWQQNTNASQRQEIISLQHQLAMAQKLSATLAPAVSPLNTNPAASPAAGAGTTPDSHAQLLAEFPMKPFISPRTSPALTAQPSPLSILPSLPVLNAAAHGAGPRRPSGGSPITMRSQILPRSNSRELAPVDPARGNDNV